MTQCLHFDLEDTNVKIFALSPGFTQTDMVDAIYSDPQFRQAALSPGDGQPPERCACMRLKSSPQSMRMGASEVAAAAAAMARWWRTRPWLDGSSDMGVRGRAQFFAGASEFYR